MHLHIVISLDNDAFHPHPGTEVANILNKAAYTLRGVAYRPDRQPLIILRNTNGNVVGQVTVAAAPTPVSPGSGGPSTPDIVGMRNLVEQLAEMTWGDAGDCVDLVKDLRADARSFLRDGTGNSVANPPGWDTVDTRCDDTPESQLATLLANLETAPTADDEAACLRSIIAALTAEIPAFALAKALSALASEQDRAQAWAELGA